ncbi:hypothetical protein [Agromyces italicus]|uniref:hypothetical protein n=1 Tax=Agromyces italicus TaxID=279572 RepID=UPI0003B3F819|nr:hypothetical protein [Agromyces italicus]
MPRRAPSTVVLLLVAGAIAFGLSGCTDAGAPNDVDASRLAALESEEPFDAAAYEGRWMSRPARPAPASVNALASRAQIDTDLSISGDAEPADPWALTFPIARDLAGELEANGWQAVAVSCVAPADPETFGSFGTVEIAATKPIEDFVALTVVRVGTGSHGDGVTAESVAPFHTESADPWGTAPVTEPTCLDSTAPPTATTTAGTMPEIDDLRRGG